VFKAAAAYQMDSFVLCANITQLQIPSWKDTIGMDLREIEWEGVDWIYLAQGRDW
jgi:hypothetical protein